MSVNRNIFYTFFTQGPALFMGLFINFFITKIIKADGRGVYAIFNADLELFSLFLGFTITSAIIFFIANKKIPVDKLLGLGLFTTAIGLASLGLIFLLFEAFSLSPLIFPKKHNHTFHYLYLALTFTLVMINSVINSIFQGKSLFKIVNWITIINSCVNFVVFGILFYVSFRFPDLLTVNHILLTGLFVYFINFCLWMVLYKKHINIRPSFRFNFKTDIRPLFIFISVGHLSHIVSFLNYRIDFWILEHYKGVQELGYYAQSVGLAQMFWSITNPILIVLIPYLAAQSTAESKAHFKFYSRLNFTVIFLGLLLFFIFAGLIFPLYGEDFVLSVLPFRILCFGILMSCITKVFATYIYTQNKLQYNLIVTIAGLAFTLLFDFLLIPTMGSIGASIATSISYTISTIATCWFIIYKFDLGFNDFFILKKKDIISMKEKIMSNYFNKNVQNP